MNLENIVCEESPKENTSNNYEPRLNSCIVCGKCEVCCRYVYSKGHKCVDDYPSTKNFMTRTYYPNKVNSIDRYVQEEIMWLIMVDFSKYFEYCICDKCYNNATGKFYA
jgi:hypothetical protein